MKILTPNKYKEKLINKITGLLCKLENTGDCDYVRSGEAAFIDNIGLDYRTENFVLFDVGANKGDYTEMILNKLPAGKVTAHVFEPQTTCTTILHNRFKDKNGVSINNFGLSNNNEQVTLFKNTEGSELASVHKRNLEHLAIGMDLQESITLQTGANYLEKNTITKINLLKVDVEGHELSVFNGFGKFLHPDYIDYIQFEYGGANLDSRTSLLELHNFLTKAGFILCKMMRSHLEIRSYDTRFENFMYQNWVAVSPRKI